MAKPGPAPTLDEAAPNLLQFGRRRRVPGGHLVVEQGSRGETLFFLLGGEVEVVRDGVPAARIRAGDVVGEYAFMEGRPRTASVVAHGPVDLVELDRAALLRGTRDDPDLRDQLLGALRQRMRSREQRWLDADGDQAFVERLADEALEHRAVSHPYLKALAEGTLPDPRWALADFARHYAGYSAHFPRYLARVAGQLGDPDHRAALQEELAAEFGAYQEEDRAALAAAGVDPEWVVGVPHAQLFERLRGALGVRGGAAAPEVARWRAGFFQVLGSGPARAVAALGLGTEGIVAAVYRRITPALDRVGVSPRDGAFFPVHTVVDEEHGAALFEIARHFAGTSAGRDDLASGMREVLGLRAGFWDWMLERALDPAGTGRL